MHWILQNNLFNEAAYGVLLETLERFGLPYSIHKVIPFIGELTPEPKPGVVPANTICMGSYSLRHAARKYSWTPGVFDLEPFNFQVQLERWGKHMLNADSVVSRFEDAVFPTTSMCSAHRREDPDCDTCQRTTRVVEDAFVRPIEDSKVFAGKVFDRQEFYDWKRKVCVLELDFGNSLTKDTLVQVCNPKTIYAEYRFWVVKGEIVCASMYKLGQRVHYSDSVAPYIFDYVRERIAEWQPHDAFVIDVAEVPNLEALRFNDSEANHWLKVVEINTLNSSGFYACNIPRLVAALEEAFGG
jgi:hypothetical protein